MLTWLALVALSLCAFGVLGVGFGVFQLSRAVRSGLNAMAQAFYLTDDEEEEDFVTPMDDAGYEIDNDTDEAFIEIAGGLGDLEREGNDIARREEEGA